MDLNRRELLAKGGKFILLSGAARVALESMQGGTPSPAEVAKYKAAEHWWAMTIDINKCIGSGNCVRACAQENGVPKGYYRTWVERYFVEGDDMEHPQVDSPDGGFNGFPILNNRKEGKSFFVPKMCNHCKDSPCVQACPYGCRYIHPTKHTVDKCTLCYHRITKGLTTACSEVCPTGARQLADLKNPKDPVHEFLRSSDVQVLKPHLATGAKAYYKGLDGVVR